MCYIPGLAGYYIKKNFEMHGFGLQSTNVQLPNFKKSFVSTFHQSEKYDGLLKEMSNISTKQKHTQQRNWPKVIKNILLFLDYITIWTLKCFK